MDNFSSDIEKFFRDRALRAVEKQETVEKKELIYEIAEKVAGHEAGNLGPHDSELRELYILYSDLIESVAEQAYLQGFNDNNKFRKLLRGEGKL